MSEEPLEAARVVKTGRFSSVLILPIVAIAIGISMVWYHYATLGPVVSIHFKTAEGVIEGKTQVRFRDVIIGVVEKVALNDTLNGVVVQVQMEKAGEPLLKDSSRFWVVRPRVGVGGVSGLGTLLSGAYITVDPGSGSEGTRSFQGYEQQPVTDSSTKGIRLKLKSQQANSLKVGDPVLYHGFEVGRLETVNLDVERREVDYQAFISAPYDRLVTTRTQFWNASGVSLKTGPDGFRVEVGSLMSLISGGVAFDVPEGLDPGEPVKGHHQFRLYQDSDSTRERQYKVVIKYLLMFDESIRGLTAGAPVEYRGIRVGTVKEVALGVLPETYEEIKPESRSIPVLIDFELERVTRGKEKTSPETFAKMMDQSIHEGLRASLKTGNLITGSMLVDMDFYPDTPDVSIETIEGYKVLPTIKSDIVRYKEDASAILAKLKALPLAETLVSIRALANDTRGLVNDPSMRQLPGRLDQSVQSLQQLLEDYSSQGALYPGLSDSVRSVQDLLWQMQSLIRTLNEKPNALIFGQDR
ncbi:intermembrane transport protein PqiB [Endozoicomonas arenosclerae]|uniref:intermembrane transport protein PqiB n=1 Tax=Endozoicomonas arenosclerae TaxID=1633495 RepID=UPI000784164A|nr:intermembrane transport protein PqiB [Endozoicomonas arenosclerae]